MKLQIMPPKNFYYIFRIHLVNINYQVKETKKNRVIVLFSEPMSTTSKSHLKKGIFNSIFLEKISRGLKYVICMANKCIKNLGSLMILECTGVAICFGLHRKSFKTMK